MSNIMSADWIGAIGTWVGAFVTAAVAYIALRQNKPKLKLLYKLDTLNSNFSDFVGSTYNAILTNALKEIEDSSIFFDTNPLQEEIFVMQVVNNGSVPVSVNYLRLGFKKYGTHVPIRGSFPIKLNPSEASCAWFLTKYLRDESIESFDFFYVADSQNELHFSKNILKRMISWKIYLKYKNKFRIKI